MSNISTHNTQITLETRKLNQVCEPTTKSKSRTWKQYTKSIKHAQG